MWPFLTWSEQEPGTDASQRAPRECRLYPAKRTSASESSRSEIFHETQNSSFDPSLTFHRSA